MVSVRPPFFLRIFDQKFITCSIPSAEKVIYLTFDDGPIPEVTPRVLRILAEFDVPATFFCVGDNVRKHPQVFQQVVSAGHAIGNHTFHHLNGWKTPTGQYLDDVNRCKEYFQTALFRPPYGKISLSQYIQLHNRYRIVFWSVLSGDYNLAVSQEQCLENVLKYTTSGAIVVFHDSLKASEKVYYTLPRMIEHFLGKRYRFEKITK
jgi:peptidoglycan-N-acetylglucosamine deacetylase